MISYASNDATRTQSEQALAAATVAFVRAHAGDTAERAQKQSTELSRTKSNASRKSQGSHLQSMLFPPRQPNFRYVQPQKNVQAASVCRKSYAPPEGTKKFPNFYVTPCNSDAAMSSPLSMMSNENIRPSSQPKMQLPSSSLSTASQQIRKARSMYYASSIQTGSPLARPPAKYLTTPPTISPKQDNSLLSSESVGGYFQHPHNSIISPLASLQLPTTVAPDESVAEARDKCLRNFQEQRQPKHKPSLFLGPFKKRQDKCKNNISSSVGAFSFGSERTPADPLPATSLKDFGTKKGKRTISNTLKHKIKKVFRRVSKPYVPVQQIAANRNYFSNYASKGDTSPVMWTSLSIPNPDMETSQRHSSRTPSFEVCHPGLLRPRSRDSNRSGHSAPSNRSLNCEAGASSNSAASRVTSWGSSSAAGTLTQRDIKRLTVIHETKDSLGSEIERSLAPRSPTRKPPSIPGLAAFREPMPIDNLIEETTTPIDPKRVFSALMREIDASKSPPTKGSSNQSSEGDVFVSQAAEGKSSYANKEHLHSCSSGFRSTESCNLVRPPSFRRPGSVSTQSNSGSMKSHSLSSPSRLLEGTIRAVTPSETHPNVSLLLERTTSSRGTARKMRPGNAISKSSVKLVDEGDTSTGHELISIQTPQKPHVPNDFQSKTIFTPTIEQIESQVQKTQLDENSAVPCRPATSETYSIGNLARKTFSHRLSDDPHPSKLFAEAENRYIQMERHPPASPFSPKSNYQSTFSPLSPSVYSRNTDGISIFPNDSVMSFDETTELDHNGTGSAVIINSHTVQSYFVGPPTTQREISSTCSSGDWKVCLSHEAPEPKNSPIGEVSIQEQYRTPPESLIAVSESVTPTGHHREFTQIVDDETTIIVHELEASSQSELVQQSTERETPKNQSIPAEPGASRKPTHNYFMPQKSREDPQTRISRDSSSGLRARPNSKQQHVSSNQTHGPSARPKKGSPSSSMMNERFPYIETGRRSSTASSVRKSPQLPSFVGSGSSSSNSTPSGKVYSDFSAPRASRKSRRESNIRLKERGSADVGADKRNLKENFIPLLSENVKQPSGVGSLAARCMGRPKSLQTLPASGWNRISPSLVQYTTSDFDIRGNRSQTTSGPATPPRTQFRASHISPVKLTTRPRSVFDLRSTKSTIPGLSPAAVNLTSNDNSRNRERYNTRNSMIKRKPIAGPALEGDTLRMLLEPSWETSGPPLSICTSSEHHRPALHLKASSSTLALNREPSPGAEERAIDTVLGFYDAEDGKRGVSESCDRSVTPGQRMAEQFLRERIAESEKGSSVSVPRDAVRSVTGSPAFV